MDVKTETSGWLGATGLDIHSAFTLSRCLSIEKEIMSSVDCFEKIYRSSVTKSFVRALVVVV